MESNNFGADKIKRYNWVTDLGVAGEMLYLNKKILMIDASYQRESALNTVRAISANWSWLAVGAITVAERDGKYWVIDGQHRVMAALSRSDVDTLPCIVFKTRGAKDEAGAFLELNSARSPVTALQKFAAMLVAEDAGAIGVNSILKRHGIILCSKPFRSKSTKAIAFFLNRANDLHELNFFTEAISEICAESIISGRLLEGLWYLHFHVDTDTDGGIMDGALLKRICKVGPKVLEIAARDAALYFDTTGGKVWAKGMMDAVNKGLRNKFKFAEEGTTE